MENKIKQSIGEQIAEAITGNGKAEIVFRDGKALQLQEPRKVSIHGIISTPLHWLEKRVSEINQKQAHILVDREQMAIILHVNEADHYETIIGGALTVHPDFVKFGINSGKYMTNFEMADLFKMNRAHFENRDVAMKLTTQLQNFKAKVDKDMENMNNNRGDRRLLLSQTVESNLPEKFNLLLPVFKGQKPRVIEIEVCVRAEDFCCSLVSAEANEFMEDIKNEAIDSVLVEITTIAPEIAVLEV